MIFAVLQLKFLLPSDEGGGFCGAKDGGREFAVRLMLFRSFAKSFSPSVLRTGSSSEEAKE